MKLGFDKVKKYLLYNDGSKNVTTNYKIRKNQTKNICIVRGNNAI